MEYKRVKFPDAKETGKILDAVKNLKKDNFESVIFQTPKNFVKKVYWIYDSDPEGSVIPYNECPGEIKVEIFDGDRCRGVYYDMGETVKLNIQELPQNLPIALSNHSNFKKMKRGDPVTYTDGFMARIVKDEFSDSTHLHYLNVPLGDDSEKLYGVVFTDFHNKHLNDFKAGFFMDLLVKPEKNGTGFSLYT